MGTAWKAGDEVATRTELAALAAEATLLTWITPLMPSPLIDRRMTVAAERAGLGRIG